MSKHGDYVTCETDAAVLLHVRRGHFRPCGKQDSDTLCGLHPAWDTRIPVESVVRGAEKTCAACRLALLRADGDEDE